MKSTVIEDPLSFNLAKFMSLNDSFSFGEASILTVYAIFDTYFFLIVYSGIRQSLTENFSL